MGTSGQTLQLTSEKAWKNAVIVDVAALVVIYLVGLAIPTLGTYVFNMQTVLAVVVGTSIGAIVIGHLRGNVIVEGFIGGVTALGLTAIILAALSQAASLSIGLIFVGNFLAIVVVKGLMKKPL